MKLLSVAIPCYNSEAYMRKAIESVLTGGEDVEILIVNDGSKDHTLKIAREYEEKYPSIIRAIDQPNKGHGGAVNTGLEHATGLYYKVIDSDDWVNESAFKQVLETLNRLVRSGESPDVMICNYVYEKEGAKRKRVMRYIRSFPENRVFGWNDVKPLGTGHYVLMHSVIFRTQLLRDCGLKLPEHTFYVDNLFAFHPMIYVKTMYYLNVNLYRYFIGRADQSVNEKVMLTRMDQQIRVNKMMIDVYDGSIARNAQQRKYLLHNISIIMAVSSILLIKSGTDESLRQKRELWQYVKDKDIWLYHSLRRGLLGQAMNLPGRGGRKVSVVGYRIAQRLYGFN